MAEPVSTHRCAHCHVERPLVEYALVARGRGWAAPDGTTRHSYCFECRRYLAGLQRLKEKRRRERSKEAREYQREMWRLQAWERRRRAGRPERGPRSDLRRETQTRLPVGPFRDWLRGERPGFESANVMAREFGIEETLLRRILNGEKTYVYETTVDQVLTRLQIPLWRVYPSLYPGLLEAV